MSDFDYGKKIKREKKVEIFNPEEFADELEFESIDDRILDQIDESDLPIPANFIEFVTSKKFLGTTVFPRQIQIASQFFEEMCPHCSNKEAMNSLYDQKLDWIYDNIVFLRNGVCPICKKTRIDFIKEGKFTFPDSLFVCCGQRCVTGDTVIYTEKGCVPISSLDREYYLEGWNQVSGVVYSDKGEEYYVAFYKSKPEQIIKVTTNRGYEIKGTREHPILMSNNEFKKLGDIKVGDCVLTYDSWITKIANRDFIKSVEVLPHKERTYDLHIPKSHRFLTNNFVSHNSGKSILGGGLIPHYLTSRILCMQNKKGKRVIPYKYFHNPPAPFYGTFTAVTLGQAMDNLWKPFKGYLDSPWWKLYFEILDYYGKKLGVELYKNNTTYLQFQHKKLAWLCEQPNKKKLRGKTRFFFGIDELSWHDLGTDDDSKLGSAKEVMASGRNSLLTFRKKTNQKLLKGNYNIPTAIECYCSSPAEANDILMRKVRESKRNPKMLGFRYATWEFNPDFKGPEDIGETDPMILARDFGANPPLGDKQYYNDAKNLIGMVGSKVNMINYSTQESKNEFGEVSLYPKLETFNYTNTYPKILTLDNGQVNNCFAASIQHIENGTVITDCLFNVRPTKMNKVNLNKCFEDFVMKLVSNKQLNIVMVAYDRWNSAQAVDKLKDSGVLALQYSPKYQDFLDVRSNFATKGFSFVKPILVNPKILVDYEGDYDFLESSYKDISFGLLYQILTVRDLGKMLAKPSTGDDDLFRAWSLGAILLRKEDYKDKFNATKAAYQSNRALGAVAMYRGTRPNAKGDARLGAIVRRKYS